MNHKTSYAQERCHIIAGIQFVRSHEAHGGMEWIGAYDCSVLSSTCVQRFEGELVGETGYGCHTFYITDHFRNIVICADIRLLLC